jgi:hypothetical protein
MYLIDFQDRHGRDHMVVGFTTTSVISTYHHFWRYQRGNQNRYIVEEQTTQKCNIYCWQTQMHDNMLGVNFIDEEPGGLAKVSSRCAPVLNYRLSGQTWSWSYGSWIYNYKCNQYISPLKSWVRTPFMAGCTDFIITWYK